MTRHIQYCNTEDNRDITGDPYAEQDANEVRVWEETGDLVLAVRMRDDGQWEYAEGRQSGELIGVRSAALTLAEQVQSEGDE